MSIRDATPDDAATIAEIYNETILAGDGTMDQTPKSREDILNYMAGFNAREGYLVLEDAQAIVGWGVIKRYSDRAGYRFCCETSVYLRRHLIGQGHGTRLKAALIERCRQYRYHHILARVWASNARSIEYNKKFGYEVVGIQKEIGYTNGQWQDVAILQLVLDDVPPEMP